MNNNPSPQVFDYNNAQSAAWVATIAGFDDIAFKLKNFTLPAVSSGMSDIGGKNTNISLFIPGDRIVLDDLALDFFIDSKMQNYRRVVRWLKDNTKRNEPLLSDVTFYLLDSNNKPSDSMILFRNTFPISISPVLFDVENADADIFCNIILKVEDFDFLDDSFN